MMGKWLAAPLSTSAHQIRLSGVMDAEVDLAPGFKGHGW